MTWGAWVGVTMMIEQMTSEELRKEGLRLYYANALEEALPFFDRALAVAPDAPTRDLLTIHKASIHVALRTNSPEVQALPAIMMRRPELRSLAAYHLATKFENEKEFKRARFYLEMGLEAARESGNLRLETSTRIDLGNLCVYDSKPDEAMVYYREALEALSGEEADAIFDQTPTERQLWVAMATQNLGHCHVVTDQPEEGIALLHRALEMFAACEGEAYMAESHLDLAIGYFDLQQYDLARTHAETGLAGATEDRQVRNAHYLLGEIAFTQGDTEAAEHHFDQLARYYPDFPQLKNLLFAIDLRKMVNFKL